MFCHIDLHLRNIILDLDGKLWLIDWSNAGFHPPYFEVAAIVRADLQDAYRGFLKKMPMDTWKEEIGRLFAIGFALTTGAPATLELNHISGCGETTQESRK